MDWNDVRHHLDVSANLRDIHGSPWYTDAEYDRFSREEYERRWAAARDVMDREGLDGMLLTGSPNNYSLGALVTWASGLMDPRAMCQYMVLPRHGDPVLLHPHSGTHLEAVRRYVAVDDVRGSGEANYGGALVSILTEKGLATGRIGVSAADRNGPEYMGLQVHRDLTAGLPDLEMVFIPDLMHQLTYLHSAEELAAMTRAGELAVDALRAVAARVAPGVREYQLSAAAVHAMMDGGGDPHLTMMTSTSMADPRAVYPSPRPSGRVLRDGDVIVSELSARFLGWSAKIGHPIVLGTPTDEMVDFHRRSVAVYRAFEDVLGPGVDISAVHEAAQSFRANGLQSRALCFHGIDMVTAGPKVFVDRVSATDEDRVLTPGRVVNIELTPINLEGTLGTFLSRTFVIEEDGIRNLTEFPVDELIVV